MSTPYLKIDNLDYHGTQQLALSFVDNIEICLIRFENESLKLHKLFLAQDTDDGKGLFDRCKSFIDAL